MKYNKTKEEKTNISLFVEDDNQDNRLTNPAYELEQAQIRLNQPHEVLGEFDALSIDSACEELELAYEDIPNLAIEAYSTEDNFTFPDAKSALEDEMEFSKEILFDWFKDRVSPHLFYRNPDEKTNFNKKVKKLIEECAAVELRVYAPDSTHDKPYILVIHAEDWVEYLTRLLKLEKITNWLKTREYTEDLLQLAWDAKTI